MKRFLMSLGIATLLVSAVNAADKVYATLDGEDITDKDLLFLRQANVDFTQLPKEMQDQAINQAIERRLLMKEAQKDKLEGTSEYKEALEEFKNTLVLELWMRKQLEAIKVSDSEVKKFYDENKDKLVVPDTADARHILVETEKEAKDIIAELNKVKGNAEAKFIELAKAKSKDPSAANGGDLGVFAKDKMVPSFANAAFALKEKTYTKTPVKTDFGYHIIYLKSKKPQGLLSFEEAKAELSQQVQLMKFREVIAQKAGELRKKAKVVIK